ncbi:MAG: hypothetical protein WBE48_04520 [Xanthobacteraceae bacterium]
MTQDEMLHFASEGWVRPAAALPVEHYLSVQTLARKLKSQAYWQDMLSGIHNPFGHHACPSDAWKFLDLAECQMLLDFVVELIGSNVILWDSELYFETRGVSSEEGEYWPVDPLSGVLAVVSLDRGDVLFADITKMQNAYPVLLKAEGTHYVIRYMSAMSHFNRDARYVANVRAAAMRPLVNYAQRPIWLVRGMDLGSNDFVTGFSVPAGRWIQSDWLSSEPASGADG